MRAAAITITGIVVTLVVGLCALTVAAAGLTVHDREVAAASAEQLTIPAGLGGVSRAAANRYCEGLPGSVLAAIGWVESRHAAGQLDPDTGDTTTLIRGLPLDGRDGRAAIPDRQSPDGWAHAQG